MCKYPVERSLKMMMMMMMMIMIIIIIIIIIIISCNTRCGHGQDIFVEVEIRKFEYKEVQATEQLFY
jgi:predicted small secreted protein